MNESTFRDDYYKVSITCLSKGDGIWKASAKVLRIDSEEDVGGVAIIDKSSERALSRVREELGPYLLTLPRPPYQWGRVHLRKILSDYRRFNNELTMILVTLQEKLSKNELFEATLHDEFWKARHLATESCIEFVRRVESLSEEDQVDLMTASDDAYEHPENPWYLDELDSRSALFGYFLNASSAVIDAHKAHQLRYIG